MAEVTECRYDVRVGRALAFGLTSQKHFRIAYTYRVGSELHTGECFSEVPHPQGSRFLIHYDPDLPHLTQSRNAPRVSLLISLIACLLTLSLISLLFLHGC